MPEETAFQIKIASTGAIIDVSPNDAIVDALLWHGIEVATSCEQGICGTCLTGVLAGEPDHRDAYQTPDEHAANNHITVCCSRSKSPLLELDL